MSKIAKVSARQIIDSRSVPTIEVTVTLDNGISAYSSAPSGGIINKAEAFELRDHNPTEYFGLGVSQAVHLVNTEINQRLVGLDPLYQNQVDQALVDLDGTPNKSRLGGNSTLATSQAVMKVAALSLQLPLFVYIKEKYRLTQDFRVPTPIFNLINGGRHGSGSLDFQEFQVVPASHLPYRQALRIGIEIFLSLERVLEQKGAIRAVGLEGGFSPNLATNTDALEILFEACKGTAYTLSKDAFLGIDASPQNFSKGGRFLIRDKNEPLTAKQLIAFYQSLHSQFRVFAFEDALLPDAWGDWKLLTAELGNTAMIIADDLIATNKTLLIKAIEENSCNAVVIKPNRAGTVTEAVEVVSLAKQAHWHTILSHRSGETNDDFSADLAVGLGTEYVKFGATSRGERVEKYNRLLRIQDLLDEWQSLGAISTQKHTEVSFTPTTPPPVAQPTMAPAPKSAPQDSAPIAPSAETTPESVSATPEVVPDALQVPEVMQVPEPVILSESNPDTQTREVHFTDSAPISIDRPEELVSATAEDAPGMSTPIPAPSLPSPSEIEPAPALEISQPPARKEPETIGTDLSASEIQQSLNQLVGSLPVEQVSSQPESGTNTSTLRPPTPPVLNTAAQQDYSSESTS